MTAELFTPTEKAAQWSWLDDVINDQIHSEISHITVGEWAERKRVLPEGLSSMPGPFSWDVNPFMREIADCMSATSPVQEVVAMKGAQITYTVAAIENAMGYIIDEEPGPMMFVSGDQSMAEASIELRVDRMIQSAGIGHKVFSQTEKKAGKGTGDTKKKKEFAGGFLLAVGPNSAAKLRTFSIRYLLLDEVDAYPQSTEGEGDPLTLLIRRTDSYEATRKILYGSTPLITQTSKINKLFLQGDQRRYFVPCKKCGEMQYLEWAQIKYEKDDEGHLIYSSVHYECKHCGAHWKNTDKAYFLPRGKWRPTATAQRPGLRSYHIPSLLSPIGMRSWESAVAEWIEAQGDPSKLRVFINTFLGEPYTERGEAPPVDRVMLRRQSDYFPETLTIAKNGARVWGDARLPDGPLILTLGADVQHDRIECELVAWGMGKESWSVGYHILPGDTSDPNEGPWLALTELLSRPTHGGLPLSLALIDSSDQTATVYTYCDRFMSGVMPIKGSSNTLTGRRIFALRDIVGHQCKRIDLDEGQLKQEFYALTKVGPIDAPTAGKELPPGYCHFPFDDTYDRRYFEKLYSEDLITEVDRYGRAHRKWVQRGRNEALDCRAYALGALYVLASAYTGAEDNSVDWENFWDALKNNT